MQSLFMKEAAKHNVLPIDDRTFERFNAALVGRPDLIGERTSLTFGEGMTGMLENVFIDVKNHSKTITAEIEIPKGGANGVILAQGGRFGGWCLYLKDGKPTYTYNFLGLNRYTVSAPEALPPGRATLVFDFAYDGGGAGKGGTGTLSVNGRKIAEGRIDRTQPVMFSADETADVGVDEATPVVDGIGEGPQTRFTGRIEKVTIEVK
jgi:arylsulfatase